MEKPRCPRCGRYLTRVGEQNGTKGFLWWKRFVHVITFQCSQHADVCLEVEV